MSRATPPNHERAAHQRQAAIHRAMTPQERLRQAQRMNRSMRELLATGFQEERSLVPGAGVEPALL